MNGVVGYMLLTFRILGKFSLPPLESILSLDVRCESWKDVGFVEGLGEQGCGPAGPNNVADAVARDSNDLADTGGAEVRHA